MPTPYPPHTRALQKELCTGKLRKHWGLQSDGDLALLMLRFIIAKGVHANAFPKVKGHAKLCDVEAGKCSIEQLHGNKKADSSADWGVELHGKGINSIIKWCNHRHNAYVQFCLRIQLFLVAMYHANNDIQATRRNANHSHRQPTPQTKVTIPQALVYGNRTEGRVLVFKPVPTGPHQYQHQLSGTSLLRSSGKLSTTKNLA